jgi:cbb3-type cytochrome oxidase cytochrome c subunit
MKMIEKFSGIFLIAGLFLFIGATLSLGVWPAWMVDEVYPRRGLPTDIPANFQSYYSKVDDYQKAILRGRDLYIREACWHCHSQYVRPVANEELRYGPVSTPGEFNTVLQLPQLFGTRRVGPDLSREAGLKSNDWHFAHLYNPMALVPESVMPSYPWYFDKAKGKAPVPNSDGVALVAYLQVLGANYQGQLPTLDDSSSETMPPKE